MTAFSHAHYRSRWLYLCTRVSVFARVGVCVCVFLLHERSKPSTGKYRQAETDRLPCSMCLLQSMGACTVSRCVPAVSDSFFLRVRFTVYIYVIDQTSRNCSFLVI